MIELAVLILLLTSGIVFVVTLIALSLLIKIPPREYILVIFSLLFQLITYVLYFPLFYFSTPYSIDNGSIIYARLGYFTFIASIVATTYAILLIDFKFSYQDIIEFLILSWVAGATSIHNAMSTDPKIIDGDIIAVYTPIGIALIFVFFIVVLYIWFRRFYEIMKVYRIRHSQDLSFTSFKFFIIFGTFISIIYIFTIFISKYQGEIPFVTGCIFSILGIIALARNNAFVFVTNITLDSIIIIEKSSGIPLYSKVYSSIDNDKKSDTDFIGPVISAININFPNTIQTKKDLVEMNFSDKTVIIHNGTTVRSILVVSSTNLIAKSLSGYLVKKFEKSYGEEIRNKIAKGQILGKRSDYTSFDEVVEYVRQFIPL